MTPDQFRAYMHLQGVTDETIRTYSSFYTRWHGHPGPDWEQRMWTPEGVAEWAQTLPKTRSSLEQARTVVGHACDATERDRELRLAVKIPRTARKKQTRALSMDDAAALHSEAVKAGVKGLAVLVGLYTAARRSEIATLAWDRVHATEVTLRRPKNDDLHHVPLHPTLAHHLELFRVDGQRWVFPGRWGGHVAYSTIGTWIGQVADQAGVDGVTPHRCRHTCLTEIVDATGDLRAAQEIAGHASPTTTALYTRASDERKRAAIGVLDRFAA